MARIRFILVAVIVLALGSCQLLKQQENFISFSWDGMQYIFAAGDSDSGNPYAVGYYSGPNPPTDYWIIGSASAADAAEDFNTIKINLSQDGDWNASVYFYDSNGSETSFYLGQIPEGMIDSLIENRDAPGEQFAGAMPGPFQGGETPVLENIIFSVERLPDEEYPAAE